MMQKVTKDDLYSLPQAIWLPGYWEIEVYRGSPLEMVESMAEVMGADTPRDAMRCILRDFAEDFGILITLPTDTPDERLSALFVYALLDTNLAKPVPSA